MIHTKWQSYRSFLYQSMFFVFFFFSNYQWQLGGNCFSARFVQCSLCSIGFTFIFPSSFVFQFFRGVDCFFVQRHIRSELLPFVLPPPSIHARKAETLKLKMFKKIAVQQKNSIPPLLAAHPLPQSWPQMSVPHSFTVEFCFAHELAQHERKR